MQCIEDTSLGLFCPPPPAALSHPALAASASVHPGFFDAPVLREAEDLRGPRRREMDAVCDQCGVAGYRNLLVRCSKCKDAVRHRYCLDTVIFDLIVEWSCSGCTPKHIKAIESLEDTSNHTTQLCSTMIKEPTMDNWKRTKARGLRTIRPQRKMKDLVDGSTKHFLNGHTSNWRLCRNEQHKEARDSTDAINSQFCSRDALDSCEVFIGHIPNTDDYEKDREDRNGNLTCTDSSSSLPLDHVSEFEVDILKRAIDGSELASDFNKCTDLSNTRISCFASSKYVDGLAPRGRKGDDIFALTSDEGSLPMIMEKFHSTLASVEQAGVSISMEKSEPLKAVIGLEKSSVASKFAPNRSKPIQGSDLKTASADVSNPLKKCFDSCSMVSMESSPSNELEDVSVQKNSAERTRCLVDEETNTATMGNLKVSKPSVENECLVSNEGTSDKVHRRSGEVLLNPLKKCSDSCSMVSMESSPSNELEDVSAQGNSAERTRCLVDEETNAATIGNLKVSKPYVENECLVSNEGNSDKVNRRSDEVLLNPLKKCLDSCSMVSMESSPSNELEDVAVQENSAERTRCPVDEETNAATMGNLKVSKPSVGNECLVSNEGSSDKVNRRSMVSMESSPSNELEDVSVQENSAERTRCLVDEETNAATMGNLKVLKPSVGNECLVSSEGNSDKVNRRSMVSMESSPSNELEDVVVQENSAERTRCFVDEEANTATMGNLKVSKPSVGNECLVSNEDTSDKVKRRSDEVLLSTKAKKITRRMSGDRVIVNSYMANVISNPESAKGDRDGRNLRRDAGKPSSLDVEKVVLQKEGIDSELLSSSFVGPCESTKINPRKRKNSESYTLDGTKHQKAATTNGIKIVTDGQSKNGRAAPAASVRGSQNMPREYNGSENLNHQCSKNHKKRRLGASKDGNVSVRNLNAGCAGSDISQLTLQTVVKEGNCGISRMPPISECVGTQPLDKPYWTGIMKIDGNYIPLAAHLSTKAGKKVEEQSRSLPPIIKVTELRTSKTSPKHLETPIPSADSIGLYFFSSDMRPNEELDQLVKHVADSGIILEATVGLAKLFLFPSFVLPEGYHRFEGKPFLWGAFKPRKEKIRRLAPVEQDCAAHITKKDHVQEHHVLDQQDKAQADTLDQVVQPENQPLLDINQEVGEEVLSDNGLPLVDMKAIVSANISAVYQGQPCSNPEAMSHKICGIVLSRTPKSAQLIQELQKQGALLFPVQQVTTEAGSVV